jgi:hypothetical protein
MAIENQGIRNQGDATRPRDGGACARNMVTALALLLGFGGAGAATAQSPGAAESVTSTRGGIHGVVRSADTGEPLPGTAVRLAELGREELTHSDGSFRLPNTPAGENTLFFQRLGYRR